MQYDLGKVAMTPKGTYSSSVTYSKLNIVYYNGLSYIYISDIDSSGHLPTDTTYWQVLTGGLLVVDTLPAASSVSTGQIICLITDNPIEG